MLDRLTDIASQYYDQIIAHRTVFFGQPQEERDSKAGGTLIREDLKCAWSF